MYRELISAIGLIMVLLVVMEMERQIDCAEKYRNLVLIVVSLTYLCGLFYMVGFRGHRVGLGGVNIRFPGPFWKAIKNHHYGLSTNRSVLNMLLFVPFGYLLPQRKPLKWYQVVGVGLLTSLLIETCQLVFRFGVFELDDLVKNTMGAALGWLLYAGLDRLFKKNE